MSMSLRPPGWTLVLGVCFWVLMACGRQTAPPPALAGTLPLRAPQQVNAGSDIVVEIGPVAADDGVPVTLLALGSYGPRLYQAVFVRGTASVTLPAQDTHQSGVVSLVATSGAARGDAQLTILPGPPVEPLVPLVGSRSIVADGNHWSMVVAVPVDALGNPVAEGTPVQVRALHPGSQLEQQAREVTHLLAWARIYSGTRAGRTTITVEVEEAHGPEETLLEVAGWPEHLVIEADPPSLPADARQLVTLRTEPIQDHFGNLMPDGTLVSFVVETADGNHHVLPAYTINGVAEVPMQAAERPGVFDVRATVYGVESERLQVVFTAGPAAGTFPVSIDVDQINRVVLLRAGPMLGPLAQYVPDGTQVRFEITDAGGQALILTDQSDAGYAEVELRLATLVPGSYSVVASVGSGSGSAQFSIPRP